jgi:hypothetical protein
MSNELSDQEVHDMLVGSWLPRSYVPKERSLSEVQDERYVKRLKSIGIDSVRDGRVVHIKRDDQAGIDAFYLTGRALTLSGIGVCYIDLPREIVENEGRVGYIAERMDKCKCIAISGAGSRQHEFPLADRFAFYWERVITNQMADGKALLLQSDGDLTDRSNKGWWSTDFITRVSDITDLTMEVAS